MEPKDNIFKFRFYGNEITPESFTLKELGGFLIAVEEAIKSVVDLKFPNVSAEEVKLSLLNVENKSESLTISTGDSPKEAIDSFIFWGNSIEGNTYVNLPEKAYNGYRIAYNLAEKKQCKAELVHAEKQIFDISYSVPLIKPENVLLKTDTIIYGELIKIGGDNAKAWVELKAGNSLNFPITKEQATQLSPSLYKLVSLKGQAKWNPQTNYVSAFKLYEVLEYKQGNIANAFKQLREATGGGWDKYNTNSDINKAIGRNND